LNTDLEYLENAEYLGNNIIEKSGNPIKEKE